MLRTPVSVAVAFGMLLAFAAPASAAPSVSAPPSVVAADGPVTWSVEASPTTEGGRRAFIYSVNPGTQVQDSFLITNGGTTSADFIIYATDAFNDPETGRFNLLKRDEPPTDLGSWITPANDKLTIGPGLQATVPFNLLIPSDATPGDHAAGIVAAVLTTTQAQDGSTVVLEQRVGVRMYLTVSGNPTASVEVQGLTTSFTPSLNPFAPGDVTVSYDVRNTGNKRVDVNQSIAVVGIFGIPLGELTPEPVRDLLPRQIVRVNVQLTGIGALLYALSTIKLEPGTVGSARAVGDPDPATTPTPTPTPTDGETSTPTPVATADAGGPIDPDQTEIDYQVVSAQSVTLAVTWTLLALIVLIVAAIYLIWRYVAGTRERMFAAIDEAAAAAREDALAQRGDSHDR